MDLAGPFISQNGLEVVHLAHYWILEADPVGAENRARLAGDLQRFAHVVQLGHRDLCRRHLALVLQATELQGQ